MIEKLFKQLPKRLKNCLKHWGAAAQHRGRAGAGCYILVASWNSQGIVQTLETFATIVKTIRILLKMFQMFGRICKIV